MICKEYVHFVIGKGQDFNYNFQPKSLGIVPCPFAIQIGVCTAGAGGVVGRGNLLFLWRMFYKLVSPEPSVRAWGQHVQVGVQGPQIVIFASKSNCSELQQVVESGLELDEI